MHAVVLKLSLTSPVNLGDLYFLLDENQLLKSEKLKTVELEIFSTSNRNLKYAH